MYIYLYPYSISLHLQISILLLHIVYHFYIILFHCIFETRLTGIEFLDRSRAHTWPINAIPMNGFQRYK